MGDADSTAVLTKIQDDGTFDDIRQKVVIELKKNAELREFANKLVQDSKLLKSGEWKKLNRKQLFDALRKELDMELMQKASDAAWAVLSSPESEVSRLIDDKVNEALCAVYEKRLEDMQQDRGSQQQARHQYPVAIAAAPAPQQQSRADYGNYPGASRQRSHG